MLSDADVEIFEQGDNLLIIHVGDDSPHVEGCSRNLCNIAVEVLARRAMFGDALYIHEYEPSKGAWPGGW